ncbi:MAG TPA: ABC transporter permease subunit [Verrucomicrobiae bacterium]|jgi:ABC-type transport system involved in multi-copper enzyme maturation permease subunit
MNVIFLIARDSIKDLLHQRILIGLMLVSFAMTVLFSFMANQTRNSISNQYDLGSAETNSPAFKNMNDQDRRKMAEQMEQGMNAIQGFFYAATSFGGSLVALMIFSTAVTSEIRRGTIRLTLSKPVTRLQYLLGKYFGGIVVMAAYAIIASIAVLAFSASEHVDLGPAMRYAPWLMFCRQLMLGSLAMLLSLFVHPAIGGILAYIAGNGLYSTGNPLYYLLPSYAPFNIFAALISGEVLNGSDVAYLTLYALDFVILMLLFALWRFYKKEVC